MGMVIAGTGSFLPERIVTNDDVEKSSGYQRSWKQGLSLDQWAKSTHGGVVRHWVSPGQATSDLATEAAKSALADARLTPQDLDLIVLSTFTGDYRLPTTAGILQANLGTQAKFIQIDAACSGFVDALLVTSGLMEFSEYRVALVVAADVLSILNDPSDYLQQTVFGDGAGAVILEKTANNDFGFHSFSVGSDGHLGDYVIVPGGGSKMPISSNVLETQSQYWKFKFPEIHGWAVNRMERCAREAVSKANIQLTEVAWVVPHQASLRIIRDVADALGISEDQFVITYPHHGNLSGASIPVALDEAKRQGRFKQGEWLVMPAVGGGMAWGAATYRWSE